MIVTPIVLKIIIIFLFCQNFIQSQKAACPIGCLKCSDSKDNSLNVCSECYENFQLSQTNNQCVYTKCSNNLFFQASKSDIAQGKCIAICDPFQLRNEQTKVCQSQQKCPIKKDIQQINQFSDLVKDFFIYQDYYVAQKPGYFQIYDRFDLNFIKQVRFLAKDIKVTNVNGIVFVIREENEISIWDIERNSRISKNFSNSFNYNTESKLISFEEKYILALNTEAENIVFLVVYDQFHQIFPKCEPFQMNINYKSFQLIDQQLFIVNQSKIEIYKIILSNHNQQLKLQVDFLFSINQNSDSFNILKTLKLGTYLMIQTQSVLQINLNDNSFEIIKIDIINNQSIIKSKIIQPYQNQYLLILTNESFFYLNIETNASNLIMTNGDEELDFEICSFWGKENQIIVLSRKRNLSIYYFDQAYKQFVKSNQIFQLNYEAQNFSSIIYKNQNQEQAIEIVTLDTNCIQLIKQGNIQYQEQQLIQIQAIAEFKLPFPTPNPDININQYTHAIISYKPSLIIHLVGLKDEIIFYDISEENKCKYKKILQLKNKLKLEYSLTKFFNNKLICSFHTSFYIIDIFRQNVIKYIESTYYLKFSTNTGILALIESYCFKIYSSELTILLQDCSTQFQIEHFLDQIYLNQDLRMLFIQFQEQYKTYKFTLYQINLDTQTIQLIKTIESINYQYFQIIKNFSSLEDEIHNKYTIEYLLIIDDQNYFKIFDFSLNLIFEELQLNINQVDQIYRVVNDDQVYVLLSTLQQSILLINIQTRKQNVLQLNKILYSKNQVIESMKHINQYNKVYYHIKIFIDDSFYEYQIDMERDITYINGIDFVKEFANTPFQFQQKGVSTDSIMNYFGRGNSNILFTAQIQKSRYLKLQFNNSLGDANDRYYQILISPKLGMYFVIAHQQISQLDMATDSLIEVFPYYSFYSQLIKEDQILVFTDLQGVYLIDFSQNIKLEYQSSNFLSGFKYDSYRNRFYVYGDNIYILNSQLEVVQKLLDENPDRMVSQCENTQNKIVCYSVNFWGDSQMIIVYDKVSEKAFIIDLSYPGIDFISFIVDEQYENIYILPKEIKVISFNGFSQQVFKKQTNECQIFTTKVLCKSLTCKKNFFCYLYYQIQFIKKTFLKVGFKLKKFNFLLI